MDEQVEVLAQEAYAAYCAKLEGKAPAGLAGPPYDLQSWAQLPAIVRAAWVAALEALLPSNPEAEPEAELDLKPGDDSGAD